MLPVFGGWLNKALSNSSKKKLKTMLFSKDFKKMVDELLADESNKMSIRDINFIEDMADRKDSLYTPNEQRYLKGLWQKVFN